MVDFTKLKKNSNSLEKLTQELAKTANPGFTKDDRFWEPTVDKAGNGYAVIRFLPAAEADGDDALPWVRLWRHAFKGPTGVWYIENSLTTIGQNDPVGEMNSRLWNSGNEADKKVARDQKRKLEYISNILVVNDPGNPENNGKVFLYKFGKKIFDKITEAMNPPFPDKEPFDPFNFWTGADFKLKIRQVEGYRNYDLSEFGNPAAIAKTDKEIEAIWKREYALQAFLDVKNFKDYDTLAKQLARVLSADAPAPKTAETTKLAKTAEVTAPKVTAPKVSVAKAAKATDEDDDDGMGFFQKLADEE